VTSRRPFIAAAAAAVIALGAAAVLRGMHPAAAG
jgi:hypothetical protein